MAQAGAMLIKQGIRPVNNLEIYFLAPVLFIITQVDICKGTEIL
jgi:hypothetical protein